MFRILKSIELQGWREQVMDMSLVGWLKCPCDGTHLRTVAAVTGDDGIVVRIGCCHACGYFGYQDRPTAEWFESFYAQDWDQNKDVDGLIAKLRSGEISEKTHHMTDVVKRIPFDASAKVFEMGTGYGWSLKCMQDLGYKNLSGIESCPHRARVAREGFGLDVRHESLETHAGGPYDVILSHHVLEHCYDPAAIVAKLASLQEPGGHLVIGVPNAEGEPTMGVIGFLPHLHSLTQSGLRILLERFGYEVVEQFANHESQAVIAKYTGKRLKVRETNDVLFAECREKMRMGTGGIEDDFNILRTVKNPCAMWPMHKDVFSVCSEAGVSQWLGDDQKRRCLRVEPIRERFTDAPVEIQWDGPLRLWVK